MSAALDVYWGEDKDPIGQLVLAADNGVCLRYERFISRTRRVSHSMPVDDTRAFPITFFDNLLPDGVQRERLARRLGVSDASTFAMLRAIGGDCAGALSLISAAQAPSDM